MPREISIDGILIPGLLPVFIACIAILWLIDWLAGRWGFYRYIWHPALFRLSIFAGMFAALGLIFF